ARMMCISSGLCTGQVGRRKAAGETPAFLRHTPMRMAHWLPNTGKPCGTCLPSMLVRPWGATQGYCVELLAGCRYQRSLKATIDVSWALAQVQVYVDRRRTAIRDGAYAMAGATLLERCRPSGFSPSRNPAGRR